MGTTINVKVQVRTGFFEKTAYGLRIGNDGLYFTPLGKGGKNIVIAAADIKNITLNEPKRKMEIQAADGLYEAVLRDETDFQKTLNALRENITAKIVCELN